MTAKEEQAVGLPGKSISIQVGTSKPATAKIPETTHTSVMELDKVKDLLSDKPLHRPNRTRPVE